MKEKVIVAPWMSVDRLMSFTACDQVLNLTFIFVKFLSIVWKSDGGFIDWLRYIFIGYATIVAILAVVLIVLGTLGIFNGIDKKRVVWLFLLGIFNAAEGMFIYGGD